MLHRFQLTGNTSRNDHHISARERLLHAIVCWEVAVDLRNGADVRQVGGDAWGVDDIVEGEVVDERARLEEQREWLRKLRSILAHC